MEKRGGGGDERVNSTEQQEFWEERIARKRHQKLYVARDGKRPARICNKSSPPRYPNGNYIRSDSRIDRRLWSELSRNNSVKMGFVLKESSDWISFESFDN